MAQNPMNKDDASRIQSSTDKKQDKDKDGGYQGDGFKERAQSAADRKEHDRDVDRGNSPDLGNGKSGTTSG